MNNTMLSFLVFIHMTIAVHSVTPTPTTEPTLVPTTTPTVEPTNKPTEPTTEPTINPTPAPIGCDQEPNSAKAVNECGLCLDSNDADFNQTGKDCKGICDGGHEWDKCGQCLLPRNISYNSCVGCDDIPYSGKRVNECGFCLFVNDTNISFANHGKDCRGKCSPIPCNDNTYKWDDCGQCLLETDPKWDICLKTPAPVPYLGAIVHIKWLFHLANKNNSASSEDTISDSLEDTANAGNTANAAISDSSGNIDNPSISTPRKSISGIYVSFGLILFILLGLCHISISICSRDKLSGQKTKGKSYKMVSINIDSNDDDDSLFNMDSTVDS